MPRVRLLSELGLNYEDMLEIANLIKAENTKRPNLRQTTTYLVGNFPYVFVAFLAAFAAQNTEREFWDALGRQLDVSGSDLNNANWRKPFIDILKNNNKPTFENVGHLYVGNMRIHGGIPSYSLGDFFANMLMPAIEKPEYIELKGKELLDALFMRSVVQLFTDSIVRNFFEFSGEIGLEFLDSSRRVAREYISKRQIPSDHQLPTYVIQKLITFLEYHEDEKHGLRRPRVQFDADEGLVLELPEQTLSGTDVRGHEVRWQVYQGNNILIEEKVRIASRGRASYTKETRTILGYVLDPFQVSFSVPTESGEFHQLREWTFDIRSQDVPDLLVFRKEDGSLLRWSQALPTQDLILVYPQDITLRFEGSAHLSHELNLQARGWRHWKAELWSLQNAWSLNLFKGDEKTAEIQIQKQLELPRLIGEIFAPNLDPKPLYVSASPILRIPLRSGVTVHDELKHWQVEINSGWEAEPSLRQVFKLSEKPESITADDVAIQFDLGAVLGTEPKGTYALHVRGPLDTDVEFPFRVWHSLRIEDLPEFILPSENQNITFHVILPVYAKLEVLAGSEGISVTGEHGRYAVELDETASRVDLNLIWPQEDSPIRVPFSLPIPRLEWRFAMGGDTKLEWSSRPTRKALDAFIQATQIPTLHVRLPGIERIANQIFLRLVDPEDPAKISQRFLPEQSALGNDHVRFSLNARDTVNHFADVSVFEFHLEAPFGEGNSKSVTLLSLTRAMDVSNVDITEDSQFLLWDEPAPLRNRRVFIRSLWKGWADSCNIKIPDDARGKFDLLTAGYGLPPSCYEVHFYVASSWEKDKTSAPEHSTYIVKMISSEVQLVWLDDQLQKHPEQSFQNHFERACLYSSIGDKNRRSLEIQLCYADIDHAKPKELFSFQEWFEKYEPMTMRAVRMKMYYPEHLQYLFASYKPNDEFRRKYLSFLTDVNNKPGRIKPESALLVIQHEEDPHLLSYCLDFLMENEAIAIPAILDLVQSGRLSNYEAAYHLASKWHLVLQHLLQLPETNIRNSLIVSVFHNIKNPINALNELSMEIIQRLSSIDSDKDFLDLYNQISVERKMQSTSSALKRAVAEVSLQTENAIFSQSKYRSTNLSDISIASRLLTPAGVGKVVEIRTSKHEVIAKARTKDTNIYLILTLVSGEIIKLDFEKKTIKFQSKKRVYACSNCPHFASADKQQLFNHQREEHPFIKHFMRILSAEFSVDPKDILILPQK